MSRTKRTRKSPIDPCDQILHDIDKPSDVVSRLNTCERKSELSFKSSRAQPLIAALEEIEVLLIGSLGLGIQTKVGSENPERRAMVALGAGTFHLTRLAYGGMARGYPIQSLVIVRAVYERVAMGMAVRSDPVLAQRVLERTVRSRDLPKWGSTLKQEAIGLVDEYISLLGGNQSGDFAIYAESIPVLYGRLSNYTHPQYDAVPLQFGVDEASGNMWFQIGPNNDAMPYAVLALMFLFTLLLFSCILLLVAFYSTSDDWKSLNTLLLATVQRHSGIIQREIAQIKEDYQVSDEH